MPDIIDLISSDPPLPESVSQRPRNQDALPSHSQIPRRPSHLGMFSSDSIDASLFTYDDFENPLKKQRSRLYGAKTHNPRPDILLQLLRRRLWPPPPNPAPPRNKSRGNMEDSDPFVITSPAPPSQKPKPATRESAYATPDIISLDDDDEIPTIAAGKKGPSGLSGLSQDSIEEFSDPFSVPGFAGMIRDKPSSKPVFSSKTTQLLASLNAKEKPKGRPSSAAGHRNTTATMDLSDFSDEMEKSAAPRRPAKKTGKMATEEKEAKARARAEAKAQKEREKELEKERKQQLKEEKAKQKQLAADLSEVNKLKVDKKVSTPEMIIDIASSLEDSSAGNQAVEFMRRLGVEHTFFESPIPNVIKWRRKVKARYNEIAGHWEPCALHIQHEKHVLCFIPAQEFVDMVIPSPDGEDRETLELHVLKIRRAYPDHKPIYLLEGLTAWMRKNRNSRNRAYQAEVLRQFEPTAPEPPTTGRGRGRKSKNKPETTPPVDDDTIEDALLTLQVTHSCLIHHTNAPAESAEWIKNFTEHVSTIPYRRERMEGNDAAFCMDVGQVKTGEDNLDTLVKMLQEVNRVTASMAYGIAGQYPCVTDLVRGMQMHGPTMLEDVRKSANKNGGLTDSRIGPAASKRLYKVFTGLDPTSTDV
ncbi:hypothetical protein N7493_007756 [Penicillium malachiteum]|uniref:ERCC4 domain-containing protein n=1 Tax=Penicillium malachiteum TaxID=1324776 RepID=A0AAD6HI83_9EURO|nr:hypothetical protein N7493_007756 [Penicillium malachiteum]